MFFRHDLTKIEKALQKKPIIQDSMPYMPLGCREGVPVIAYYQEGENIYQKIIQAFALGIYNNIIDMPRYLLIRHKGTEIVNGGPSFKIEIIGIYEEISKARVLH